MSRLLHSKNFPFRKMSTLVLCVCGVVFLLLLFFFGGGGLGGGGLLLLFLQLVWGVIFFFINLAAISVKRA